MKKIFLIILSIALAGAIFFSDSFIKKNGLTATLLFTADYFKTDLYKENAVLKFENENLKAQLQKLQIFNSGDFESVDFLKKYLKADIFSSYPFNVKNILVINKGINDNVKKDMAVVLNSDIFVGQVAEVFENSASIKTVFDPNWQIPVKIGEGKINGLFKGGNDPKITLIEKPIKIGDSVFLASKDFPIHLKIGDISEIKEEMGGIFKEAAVQAPYNINELEEIYLTL